MGAPNKFIFDIGSESQWSGSNPIFWVKISDMAVGGPNAYGGILANFTSHLILENLTTPYINGECITVGNRSGGSASNWSQHTVIKNVWAYSSGNTSVNFTGIKLTSAWIAKIENVIVNGPKKGIGTGYYLYNTRDCKIENCQSGLLDKHYHVISANIYTENIWWEGGNYGVYMENGSGGRVYNYSPLAGPANLAYYDSRTKNKILFLQPGQELDPTTQNIFNGITTSGWSAGTICWSQSATGQNYKKVSVFVNFYKNETENPQKIIFPTPFTIQPSITRNDLGDIFTITTTDISFPVNMTSNTSQGWLILEGS